MEDRRLLAMLGVTLDDPVMFSNSTGTVQYDAVTDRFAANATPINFFHPPTLPFPVFFDSSAPKSWQLSFDVDASGNLIGGVAGDDLSITGGIDIDADGTLDVNGTLLTGEITAFGWQNSPTTNTDNYDARLTVTGGLLAQAGTLSNFGNPIPRPNYFDGKDIGVQITSEVSTFGGAFTVSFSGGNKVSVGPTDKVVAAEVSIEKFTRVDDPPPAAIDIQKYVKPVVTHSGDVCETTGRPVELVLQYVPGSDLNTSQDAGKATVSGAPDGTPADSYFVVSDGGSKTYFSATVADGDSFTALASNAGASEFSSNTVIELYDNEAAFLAGDAALQTMQYHTSCSQPIRLGDVVGSVTVAGVVGKNGTVTSPTGIGDDADTPTGPEVMVGSDVMWTYVVTNPDPNNRPVANVVVTDDAGTPTDTSDDFIPTFVEGDDGDGLLEPGEQWVYTATGTVTLAGQYRNIGKVTGQVGASGTMVMDDDPAHYLGVAAGGAVCDDVGRPVELTFDYIGGSGLDTSQDAGKAGVSGVVDATPTDSYFFVTDSTDLSKVFSGAAKNYFSGTVSLDGQLNPKAANAGQDRFSSNMMIYLFDNEAAFNASASPLQTMQYHTSCSQPIHLGDVIGGVQLVGAIGENGGTAILADELPPLGPLTLQGATVVLDVDDPFDPGNIGVDADDPIGPIAQLGDKITFTYAVTNPGTIPLTDVTVTDNTGVMVKPVLKTNGNNFGDANDNGLLDPASGTSAAETWYFQAMEIADETGQQVNIGKVTAGPGMVMDDDPSHHFVNPLDLEKFTRSESDTSGLVGLDVCDDLGLDKFQSITLVYNGGNELSNPQESRASVNGTLSDPPPMDVFIVGSKDSNGANDLFFSGPVTLGDSFNLDQSFSGTGFGSATFVFIYDADPAAGGNLLQSIEIHTSCSKPLALGDVFGGVTFVGAVDEDGDSAFLPEPNPFDDLGADADSPSDAVPIALGDKVVFTYKVSNNGDTPITIDNVTDDNGTPGDPSDDLYWIPPAGVDQAITEIVDENGDNVGDINADGLLDPGEMWLFQAMDIVRQEQLVGNKGTVTGTVTSGGTQVALMDMDLSHHVGVLPAIDLCETQQKPVQVNLRYTASDEFNNTQGDKAKIKVDLGTLVGQTTVFIRVTDSDNAFDANVDFFFGGTVSEGDVIGVDARAAGRTTLPSKVFVHYLNPVDGTLIRTVEMHTSCSAPLVLGEQFAGSQLAGFVGDGGAILGLQPDAAVVGDGNIVAGDVWFTKKKMKFTLTNVGDGPAVLENLLFSWAQNNKKLKKIKIDGVEIFRTATDWTASGATIGANDWKANTLDNRTIAAGQVVLVEFEFESNASTDSGNYDLIMYFDVDGDDDGALQAVDVI